MKCLIVFLTLLSFSFATSANENTEVAQNLPTSTSDVSQNNSGLEIANSAMNTSETSKTKSTMLYYVIPATVILLVAICSIAISKRLFFEK
ncbi:MAG: hypothetical protein ACI857_002209 [Arenicella sp.]|jgi:hypothetical protein